ncbi:MAG: Ubiquinone biosynthesis O-methyltransferase [Myxococcota bacterium]|nr:Ubiquinone biosynthesis O-methyltransferase [Myxococcota bacterium]
MGLKETACPLCGSIQRRVVWRDVPLYQWKTAIHRCRECGLVHVSPRLAGAELLRQYQEPESLRRFLTESYVPTLPAVEEFARAMLRLLRARAPRGSLLDYGAGLGVLAREARALGYDSIAFEMSPVYGEIGRRHANSTVEHDWTLAERRAPYDVLVSTEVVEHLEYLSDFLRPLSLLRGGGLVLLSTPNFNSLARFRHGPRWDAVAPDGHLQYFTAATLTEWMRRLGVRPLQVLTWGPRFVDERLPAPLLRLLGDPPGGPTLVWLGRKM